MTRKAKALVITAFLACAVVAVSAVVGSAASSTINEVFIHCTPNGSQQVDPIIAYGHAQSAHLHTPAGADDFSSTTTVADMVASTTVTSCDVVSDHSLFWFPTPMTAGNVPATILNQSYYLTNTGFPLDPNAPTPNGLRFIVGNSACAETSCALGVEYQCAGVTVTAKKIPTVCSGGRGYNETIYAQNQCWDGQSLGEGMGDSTPPNVIGANLLQGVNGVCPDGWMVIPGIVWTVHVGQDGVGGYLSSDAVLGSQTSCPGCSGHFDFVFGQDPAALSAIEADCLNTTGFPAGPVQTCVEKANGDGTDSLFALDANGRYTIFVTR